MTGWQAIETSDQKGEFEIAVLPGKGRLLVTASQGDFILHEIGSNEISRGRAGGERNYAHAIQRLDLEAGAAPVELTVELKHGASIAGRIATRAGGPVRQALMITRLNAHPSSLTWRFPLETTGGRFELSGLAQGREYPVHFLDAKNRLGATVIVTSTDTQPAVVLIPCGEAVARFVDQKGRPIAGFSAPFEIVVTPGPQRFGAAAMKSDELAADAGYVANIDRTNYRNGAVSDKEGRVTFPALIPGAQYREYDFQQGRAIVLKDFVAESGQTLDLGELTFPNKNKE